MLKHGESTKPAKAIIKTLTLSVMVGGLLLMQDVASRATSQEAGKEPSREEIEFFEKKIRPVLADNCYGCHSAQAKKLMGQLLLDSREGMLKGGTSGQPALIPGDPENSLLIKAIRYTDSKPQMPPAGKLPDQVIKDFEQWVKMGAPDPRKSQTAAASTDWQPYDFNEAKKFWSFQPIKDSSPPQVKDTAWVKTPIDNFILAKLEEKGLKPLGEADKRTLIRRATFDLTGLPPTPEEVEAFLNDKSPNAFEKVVDRLLASSAYGEKWGRHWLDVVRYADTAGCNSDFPIPSAYKYRNYVIKSFNEDKPYDQFIREQIAGDLLPSKTEAESFEKLIATGYIAISRRFGSRNKEFHLTIDDTIDNLGKAFLGLSISCARCHDHKFDPIPMRDYYALYGIFNSSRYAFPGQEIYPHPADFVALASGREAERFYSYQKELTELDDRKEFLTAEKGYAARNKKLKQQQAKPAQSTASSETKAANEQKGSPNHLLRGETASDPKPADFDRDADNWSRAAKTTRMPEEVEAELREVRARIAQLHDNPVKVEKAYAVVDGYAHNARIHRRGDRNNLGDEVPRGFLTILGGQKVPADYKGSGRDLLAGWIADPKNPLTARVMVNRIWQYHFGQGLVKTPNDFGTRGAAPTHPELLDWLAARLIESGWSVKKMHRLIMLSRVYQLASAHDPKQAAIDVNNDYLWRFNRRRLSAEEIRDAIMAVSGTLDRTMGGEHPFPPENTWRYTQHEPFFALYETNRRSLYLMQQRLKKHPFFEIFDGADQSSITAPRNQSTTPLQALFLMNNAWLHEQADQFAVRVGMAYDNWRERIDYAFRLAYGRPAKDEEIKEAMAYLRKVREELQAVKTAPDRLRRASLASYLRVLLSSNEFLYLD